MTTLISENTPDSIRGMLKRWFLEPKPNVFVGSVNVRTREKVISYIRRNAPHLAMLVISEDNSAQGYSIVSYGNSSRRIVRKSGLQLVQENPWETREIIKTNGIT